MVVASTLLGAHIKVLLNYSARSRRLVGNVVASVGIKGAAMVVSFVSMPVFMSCFEDDAVLGLWFTMLSLVGWILLCDFGIGNGLRNRLAMAFSCGAAQEIRSLIVSSYFSMAVIVAIFSLASYIAIPYVDWNSVLNVSQKSVDASTLTSVVQILAIGLWAQFFLKLVSSILYAMQKAAIPSSLVLISNSFLLIFAFLLEGGSSSQNLYWLSQAYVFTANAPLLLASLLLFAVRFKRFHFKAADFSLGCAKSVFTLGMHFFTLQILSLVAFNTREIIISQLTGTSSVVDYTVYYKVFSVMSTFFLLALTPAWSAITEAATQGDFGWIFKLYSLGRKVLVGFTGLGILLVFAAPMLVRFWLGENSVIIDPLVGLIFVIYNSEYMWISLHAHFENGLENLRVQRLGYVIACLLLLLLSVLLTRCMNAWQMIMVGSVLSLLPMCCMQFLEMRKIKKRWSMRKRV